MQKFSELKERQLAYLEKIERFKDLVDEMSNGNSELLSDTIRNGSYSTEADGLIVQLQNPNISLSVVAEVAQGKSTFLNALIFKDQVLHSGAGAVTARLFKIDYDKTYSVSINGKKKTFDSIENLKEEVRRQNEIIREMIENNKSISSEKVFEVDVTLPHPALKEGVTLYDTPGFGSLDEDIVYPLIHTAVAKSDAVVMLIDISAGLKRGENRFVKDVLRSIPAQKRFVVFNKLDAVINEDQKILMPTEEINRQLKKVEIDTLKELSSLAGIPQNEIIFYMLSSSKALAGYVANDRSKMEESRFDAFEEDFWQHVVDGKREVFNDRIVKSKSLIQHCDQRVEQVLQGLYKNLEQLKKLQDVLVQNRAEFSAFSKQAISSLDEEIRSFTNDFSTLFDINTMMDEIEDLMQQTVYDELDEIDWIDKLKLWRLKDIYIEKIQEALKDSSEMIVSIVAKHIDTIQQRLYAAQNEMNSKIKHINEKIEAFEDLGVQPLDYIDLLEKDADGNIELNADSNFSEFVSVDNEVYLLIAGLVTEIVVARLALLIPGIGLAISGVIFTFMKIYKNYKDPNRELAAKIAQSVAEELQNDLAVKLGNFESSSKEIKNAMTTAVLTAKSKIEMIQNSFENPEERQVEIEQIGKEKAFVEDARDKLNKLMGA